MRVACCACACLLSCLLPCALALTAACEAAADTETFYEDYDEQGDCWLVHNMAALDALHGLTKLTLNMQGRKPRDGTWRGLACLTTLKSLTLENLDFGYLGGVLKLTSCQQLTHLQLNSDEDLECLHLSVSHAQHGLCVVMWSCLAEPVVPLKAQESVCAGTIVRGSRGYACLAVALPASAATVACASLTPVAVTQF
jgi:hypothetical protein